LVLNIKVGNMMKSIVNIFICLFLLLNKNKNQEIPKIEIFDHDVLSVIDLYDKKNLSQIKKNSGKNHLIVRVEQNSPRLVYIQSVSLISIFYENVPDAYSEYKGRKVFVYYSKIISEESEFKNFYNQFESDFDLDVTKEANQNSDFHYENQIFCEIWRVELENTELKDIKIIPKFPNKTFYEDYKYRSDGVLVFKDGIFPEESIDSHQFLPDNFNLRAYIIANTSVSEELLSGNNIIATLVIDENGKVLNVELKGIEDNTINEDIKLAFSKMRKWRPGKFLGNPVKVRIYMIL